MAPTLGAFRGGVNGGLEYAGAYGPGSRMRTCSMLLLHQLPAALLLPARPNRNLGNLGWACSCPILRAKEQRLEGRLVAPPSCWPMHQEQVAHGGKRAVLLGGREVAVSHH